MSQIFQTSRGKIHCINDTKGLSRSVLDLVNGIHPYFTEAKTTLNEKAFISLRVVKHDPSGTVSPWELLDQKDVQTALMLVFTQSMVDFEDGNHLEFYALNCRL